MNEKKRTYLGPGFGFGHYGGDGSSGGSSEELAGEGDLVLVNVQVDCGKLVVVWDFQLRSAFNLLNHISAVGRDIFHYNRHGAIICRFSEFQCGLQNS